MKIWPTLMGALSALTYAGYVVAGLALTTIVASYAYEVVARYLFSAPTWWSAELVSYLLCVMTLSMMPYVTATRGQIAVTVILERFDRRTRANLERFIWLLGFAACCAMTWFSAAETTRQFTRSIQMMAAYPIPKWWVSIWIVAGFGLTALQFLRLAVEPRYADESTAVTDLPRI